jgi:hypothetical protein
MKEYFLLSGDRRYNRTPRLKNPFSALDKGHINTKEAHKLPERIILEAEERDEYDCPDIFDDRLFLVSEKVKRVFSFYDENMPFKTVVLLCGRGTLQSQYFLPVFEDVFCLHENSEYTEYKVLKRIVLDREKIRHKSVFRIAGHTSKAVIRLDAAESLLRRNATGLTFTEAEVR